MSALAFGSPALADPIREAQWHLSFLKVTEAHQHSQGEGVVVGVVDTGVDATHPDLVGSVLQGQDFSGEGGGGREDLDGHGTGMAGIIAAHGRTLGIAPKAQILPIRDRVYGLSATTADKGIPWAVDHGATVLCLAFGQTDSPLTRQAIQQALASDVVIVAGMGNEPSVPGYIYPAAYPGVIGVAGIDRTGNHAKVSVVGSHAMLAAPAVEIVAIDSRSSGNTGYRRGTGTSDATAIVAGAAALVRAKFPELSAAEVIHRLTATADDKGAPGRDGEYGFGVVNLVKALTADVPPLSPSPSGPPPNATAAPTGENDDSGGASSAVVIIGALTLLALLVAGFIAASLGRRSSP